MQREHAAQTFRHAVRVSVALWIACACFAGCSNETKPIGPACDQGSVCRDSDCDTICDADEGGSSVDTDRDGTPDYLDTDSDGDGIDDKEEAGDGDRKTKPFDRDLNGVPDYLDDKFPLGAGVHQNDAGMTVLSDGAVISRDGSLRDGSGEYDIDSGPILAALCPDEAIVPQACLTRETNECNGLDDDCDGKLDGDHNALCECERGEVRSCFRGPPGRRGVGACEDGMQVCVGDEFSYWGPCVGGNEPSAERCNGLDDDCNGCADEIGGCKPSLACPGPGDTRTPTAKPFTPYNLDAGSFFGGSDALSYQWEIVGSPCDRMFAAVDPKATSTSGKLSYQLKNATSKQAEVMFTLSGSYQITLRVMTKKGEQRCSWTVRVRAPGVRVELCWDKTGPSAKKNGDAVDLDLHLGKWGDTTEWSSGKDCYWNTCRGAQTPFTFANTTDLSKCTGPGAQNYAAYSLLEYCPNPRLDADSRLDSQSAAKYIAENINLDTANKGDVFRVMVHYQTNVPSDSESTPDAGVSVPIGVHPIVNVYCNGDLQGSFGGDPDTLGDSEELGGFDTPGQMWRVVDVAYTGKSCTLAPLAPPPPDTGYFVTDWDPSYDGN